MNNEFFYCYDERLAKWLRYEKGITYITRAIHPKTIKVFCMFKVSDELDNAINEYKLSLKGR